jgi:hypothetical protein
MSTMLAVRMSGKFPFSNRDSESDELSKIALGLQSAGRRQTDPMAVISLGATHPEPAVIVRRTKTTLAVRKFS